MTCLTLWYTRNWFSCILSSYIPNSIICYACWIRSQTYKDDLKCFIVFYLALWLVRWSATRARSSRCCSTGARLSVQDTRSVLLRLPSSMACRLFKYSYTNDIDIALILVCVRLRLLYETRPVYAAARVCRRVYCMSVCVHMWRRTSTSPTFRRAGPTAWRSALSYITTFRTRSTSPSWTRRTDAATSRWRSNRPSEYREPTQYRVCVAV